MRHFLAGALVVGVLAMLASRAASAPLRSPQVAFDSGPLQAYMNGVEPGHDVRTEQLDAPTWSPAAFGNVDFKLTLESGAASGNAIGLYDAGAAARTPCPVFPSIATPGWYAYLHFGSTWMSLGLFDPNQVLEGVITYPLTAPKTLGYYAQAPCGTWYSQDAANQPPGPQALVFASLASAGAVRVCFESCAYDAQTSTFTGEILRLETIPPLPAVRESWGRVKGLYR